MGIKIHSIQMGMNHCYLIRDKGIVMIDGGFPGTHRAFIHALADLSIKPADIGILVLTHGHFDHIGSANQIRQLTGAKVMMHKADKEQLDMDSLTWSLGVTAWGRISRGLMKPLLPILLPLLSYEIPQVDVLLGDEELSLEDFGISGRIIHTPGHSPGSVSVLLDSGDAFVGCLAQNSLPFSFSPRLPIYAQDVEKVKESWRVLIAEGARIIHPGHGRSFSIDIIQGFL